VSVLVLSIGLEHVLEDVSGVCSVAAGVNKSSAGRRLKEHRCIEIA